MEVVASSVDVQKGILKSSDRLQHALVLKALRLALEKISKPFEQDPRVAGRHVDAIACRGMTVDIEGRTLIEVNTRAGVSLQALVRSGLERMRRPLIHDRFDSALLILASSPLSKVLRGIVDQARKEFANQVSFPENRLHIWGLDDLESFAGSELQAELDSKTDPEAESDQDRFERAIALGPDGWREDNETRLENLAETYKDRGIVMFLGAGVSRPAGLPDWDALLENMWKKSRFLKDVDTSSTGDLEITSVLKVVRKALGDNPLIEARALRTFLTDMDPVIRESLYQDLKESDASYLKLSEAIVGLIKKGSGVKGVKAVVTYNFDDLLEKSLEKQGIPHRSIRDYSDRPDPGEIGIFHVHGFLPSEPDKYTDSLPTARETVLSEEGYHKLFLDPYDWSNFAQLAFLSNKTMLALGLSMTDPNLRRLLEIARTKLAGSGHKHYAIFARKSLPKLKAELEKELKELLTKKDAPEIEEQVIEQTWIRLHCAQEILLEGLGIEVIWVEGHEEIPDLLAQIQGSQ